MPAKRSRRSFLYYPVDVSADPRLYHPTQFCAVASTLASARVSTELPALPTGHRAALKARSGFLIDRESSVDGEIRFLAHSHQTERDRDLKV